MMRMGRYSFDGSETGFDFADYLIGAPVNFTQASQQLLDSRNKYFGVMRRIAGAQSQR